jgi:hypothetical protein
LAFHSARFCGFFLSLRKLQIDSKVNEAQNKLKQAKIKSKIWAATILLKKDRALRCWANQNHVGLPFTLR